MLYEKNWVIRKAAPEEYLAVRTFYHTLIDQLEGARYSAGWEKEVYPADEYLREALAHQELFVGEQDGNIVGAMIINHSCNESYVKVKFSNVFAENEIMVAHALGVLPEWNGQGYGKSLVEKLISYARAHEQKAIRLDVLSGNLPAEKLYLSMGFQYIDVVSMYYEDTGWTDYKVYEYVLERGRY